MVTNFVCAPPSLTPGNATGDVAISFIASGGVSSSLVGESHLEVTGHRDVEHRVDRVLALAGRDLADRPALVALLDLLRVRARRSRSS